MCVCLALGVVRVSVGFAVAYGWIVIVCVPIDVVGLTLGSLVRGPGLAGLLLCVCV